MGYQTCFESHWCVLCYLKKKEKKKLKKKVKIKRRESTALWGATSHFAWGVEKNNVFSDKILNTQILGQKRRTIKTIKLIDHPQSAINSESVTFIRHKPNCRYSSLLISRRLPSMQTPNRNKTSRVVDTCDWGEPGDENSNTSNFKSSDKKSSSFNRKPFGRCYTPESVSKAIRWRVDRDSCRPLSPPSIQFLAETPDEEEYPLENCSVKSLPQLQTTNKWMEILQAIKHGILEEFWSLDDQSRNEIYRWTGIFVVGFLVIAFELTFRVYSTAPPKVQQRSFQGNFTEFPIQDFKAAPQLETFAFVSETTYGDVTVEFVAKNIFPDKFIVHRNPKVCLRMTNADTHTFLGCLNLSDDSHVNIILHDVQPGTSTVHAVLLSDMKKLASKSTDIQIRSGILSGRSQPSTMKQIKSENDEGCQTVCTKTCTTTTQFDS